MNARHDQELVHGCYVDAFRMLAEANRGSVQESPGMVAVAVGVPIAGMNVGFAAPTAAGGDVAEAIAHFERLSVPFCLRFPEPPGPSAASALAEAGLTPSDGPPAMLARSAAVEARETHGLQIAAVRGAEDEDAFVAVNAEAFGMPEDVVRSIFGRHLLSERVEEFIGSVDGEAVATSCSVLHDGVVGVYNVATRPGRRGRGLGAAMTAAAVGWGAARGRSLATLQSSPMGLGIYTRLGFRTVVSYQTFSRSKS